MQTEKPKWSGGLSGKARRERGRHRAARLYGTQLVDEYLDDGPPAPGGRHWSGSIPIKGRAEFLPTVTASNRRRKKRRGTRRGGSQLELPYSAGDHVLPLSQPEMQTVLGSPIRFPLAAETRLVPRADAPKARETPALSFRGFLLGCAMGSAAAAVMLLMVRTAVG